MAHNSPVIIIGGGIVGLSTAWALGTRNIKSIIVDRDRLGGGASYGNAGLIIYGHPPVNKPGISRQGIRMLMNRDSPLYIKPRLDGDLLRWLWGFHRHCTSSHVDAAVELLAAMGWQSKRTYEEILSTLSIDCDWRANGWIDVCTNQQSLDEAEKEIDVLAQFGFDASRLQGDAFHEAHPGFTPGAFGAIHYAQSATLCPRAFSQGLKQALLDAGTRIQEETPVQKILHENGRTLGVQLAGGETIEGETVVIAAGTWSSAIAKSVGMNIPMQPARGYHRDLRGLPTTPDVGGVIRGTSIAFTPMFDRLRLAGTLELAGYDQPWITSRLDALTRGAARVIQGVDEADVVDEWAGYRPCTHDGLPILGGDPELEGLYVASGHSMMGMTLGPYSGVVIADLICGRTPEIDTHLLRANRFN